MKKLILIALLILTFNFKTKADTDLQEKVIVKNLDTPWEILWGPDDYIWMTERFGRISRVNPANGEVFVIDTIKEVFEDFERGLLGMVLHPDFKTNPYLYVAYTTGSTNANTRVKIVRYTYWGQNKISDPQILINEIYGYRNHDGSRLWIDKKDMTMYFTMGDAADKNLAQNMKVVNGKILRMKLDGTAPSDNPFYGKQDTNALIWSYGHRNPQGLVFANGKIYSAEHGETTNDELNLILKGRNYGWPEVEGFCDSPSEKQYCKDNNIVEPLASYYIGATIAPCGIDYYNHNLIPEWNNSILLVALKGSQLIVNSLSPEGTTITNQKVLYAYTYGRIRDLCISPDGRVFIATSNKDGRGVSPFPKEDDDKIIEIKPLASGLDTSLDNFKLEPYISDNKLLLRDIVNFGILQIEIFNQLGGLVETTTYTKNGIDISNFSQGVYLIRLKIGENTYISKFIK